MKHAPELFHAKSLENDTRLLFKTKLLLGTVCAYGGEVPLNKKELANRLQTSVYRMGLLLKKLEIEGIVSYDQTGRLFFRPYVFIKEKETYSSTDVYSKNFQFFTCEDFLKEERNVQRFVLHVVGYRHVYLPGCFAWIPLEDLYGESGILNLKTPKEALHIVERAEKFLHLAISKTSKNIHITGVKKKWLEMGEVESEGSFLWVKQRLQSHNFCMDFISDTAIIQIAKVMEYYYDQVGYQTANDIFEEALTRIQNDPNRSLDFYRLIYREEAYQGNEADQISAYFREVMRTSELIQTKHYDDELSVLQSNEASLRKQQTSGEEREESQRLNRRIRMLASQIYDISKFWKRRQKSDPDWINQHSKWISLLKDSSFRMLTIYPT